MSDILLNFINNNIGLSKTITNIEQDFQNGVYFCELIEKAFNINQIKYNKNPKNNVEISNNFEIVKNNLRLIGIPFSDETKKEIIEGKNGAAAKLIYKIKVEYNRRKIDFDHILEKMNKNSLRLNKELNRSNINKNFFTFHNTKEKDEFPNITTVSSRDVLPTFTNFYHKPNKSNKNNKIYNFRELHKYIKLKPMFNNKQNNRSKEDKISFPNIKLEEKKISLNNTFQSSTKKNTDKTEDEEILVEINEEEKHAGRDINSNYYLTTGFTNDKKMKKNLSLYEYNDAFKNMKQDIFNHQNKSTKASLEKINYDNLLKYSSFYNNSFKIGLNMEEIAPDIKKNAIIYNNDFLFSPKHIKKHLNSYLTSKNEVKKIKLKNVISPSSKNSFLNEQKKLIKKSLLNMANTESKLFQNRFDKNTSIYKRLEYSKKYDEINDSINRQLKNKKFLFFDNTQTSFPTEEIKQFDVEEYFNNLNSEKDAIKLDENIKKENYNQMKKMIDLIVDIADLCHKRQLKLNEELIEIPEYREWNNLFIEGKSCLSIQIKRKKIINNLSTAEKTNNSSLGNVKTEGKKENIKKKENEINDDLINMEFFDYLNLRGNWDIDNFVDKDLLGKQMNLVDILGNDIFKLINISSDLIQNLKQILVSKKFVDNKEFELTEGELNNILVPSSNINNNLFGEIILLNYDNILNEYSGNKIKEKNIDIENNNKIPDDNLESKNESHISKNVINNIDFSYIPIKICFIGHSYSGRKTQANLLCEKYKNLKSYSIDDITKFYLDEYKRINLVQDQNTKNNKATKKSNINENKILEEREKYKYVFDLIEGIPNFDKNNLEDLTLEKISDDIKINLLIYQIKSDFPQKPESEINTKIQERIQKRQNLEQELKKLTDQQNNETNNNDNNKSGTLNKKETKKISSTPKKNNSLLTIQNITEELEKLKIESIEGFILYDYPTTFNQLMKLENSFTGYIQPIDKDVDLRDVQINNLTNSIDKPYINISNSNQEISSFFNNQNNLFKNKSFFNAYFFIELPEEETIKRMNNRLQDPNTGIIYHKEYNPPNPNDKKLNERLIELKEPSDDQIKELITQFYSELPKILYAMNLFKNYYKIEAIEKNEVLEKIESGILLEEKKYEEGENNDLIGNLDGNLNNKEEDEKNEVIKYIKRVKEIKKVLPKGVSEEIIKYWTEIQDKYKQRIKGFIKNFLEIKNKIIEQMYYYQEDFIDFLNNSSKKYNLVDIFYKKYNLILEKFPHLKSHHLIKEEIDNDMMELSGNLWELIQERKLTAISELDKIKNQKFIEENLELFGNYIINLIILETKQYFNKVNLIKKFYYEFEKPRLSEKFPYKYNFKEEYLLEDINDYQIFIPPNAQNSETKEDNIKNEQSISPKLDKIYINCFKLFFIYDQEMLSLKNKLRDEFNNINLDRSSLTRSPKRFKSVKKKKTFREANNNENNNIKIIKDEEELSLSLNNEKIKYKIRILFIKNFAEKKLQEIYNIGQKTFENLDKYIIDSVNSQNSAMNELILKIKKHISEGYYKLQIKDVELDIFDIYEKANLNFDQFSLKFLNTIPEEDKKINYKELHNIYLDLKQNYEIQDNYVTLNTFFDIVIKKYLFDLKSTAFMKYMLQMPFIFIYGIIDKFVIKKSKKYSVIKLNEIFTILGLINKPLPKKEQINNIMKNINDKLKYKIFLTKNDFISNNLWFEKNETKKKKNNLSNSNRFNDIKKTTTKNLRSPSIMEMNVENKLKDFSSKEKKNKLRGSRVFPKLKFSLENIIKELSEDEQLKEYLFNINKNQEELVDMNNFKNIISIKKNFVKKKTKIHFNNLSDIKSSLDKDEILSINSVVESIDKAQMSEPSNKLLIKPKISGINNLNNIKNKIIKNNKINEGSSNNIVEVINDEKININFPEFTYFDYLIKM